jgi:hypothetical protein
VDLDILDELPAQSYDDAERICRQLISGGPDLIRQLVEMVGDEFGSADGVQPKYALHGLAVYASRPGAEEQRKMVAGALAGELGGEHSDELKAFLCRQLQVCGCVGEVSALAKLLASERLCEPAAQALLAIGCEASLNALQAALPDAQGDRQATIVQAVNVLSGK